MPYYQQLHRYEHLMSVHVRKQKKNTIHIS